MVRYFKIVLKFKEVYGKQTGEKQSNVYKTLNIVNCSKKRYSKNTQMKIGSEQEVRRNRKSSILEWEKTNFEFIKGVILESKHNTTET